jgi:nitroreductase
MRRALPAYAGGPVFTDGGSRPRVRVAPMETWKALLETAVRAPSPHNVQPWKLRLLSEHEADLFIDKARTLPKEDLSGSFIILTMGMFIEALGIVAANRGLRLDHSLHQDLSRFTTEAIAACTEPLLPFARLTLSPGGAPASGYPDDLFMKRQTSRIPLRTDPVPPEATQAFAALAKEWDQRYESITDASRIEPILAWNTEAVFADLNSADYHDEIVSWFRFTDRASAHHRDGLDYRCMNASRVEYFLLARTPWVLTASLTTSLMASRYRQQIGPIPTIGYLAV